MRQGKVKFGYGGSCCDQKGRIGAENKERERPIRNPGCRQSSLRPDPRQTGAVALTDQLSVCELDHCEVSSAAGADSVRAKLHLLATANAGGRRFAATVVLRHFVRFHFDVRTP